MKIKAWHGTLSQEGRFDNFSNYEGFVSFCTERDGARRYAALHDSSWTDGSRLFEVTLIFDAVLDFRIPEHTVMIKEYLDSIDFDHFPRAEWDYWICNRGAYQCIEHIDLLKRHGFSGAYTCEDGWLNVHTPYKEFIRIDHILDQDPGQLLETLEYGVRKTSICREMKGLDPMADNPNQPVFTTP